MPDVDPIVTSPKAVDSPQGLYRASSYSPKTRVGGDPSW